MDLKDRLTEWVRHAFFYGDNWVSILGGILTTASGFTLLWSWFRELASPHSALPYVGLLLFIALPAVFLLPLPVSAALVGLALVAKAAGKARTASAVSSFERPHDHRGSGVTMLTTSSSSSRRAVKLPEHDAAP